MLIGTLGKIARDISLQMQTEIDELAEPAAAGKGGSSTMPHKRNPVGCAAVLTAATRSPNLVATIFAGMVQEHERALGGWQAEWEALPDLARLTGGALAQIKAIVAGIEVDAGRLAANLGATRGLVLGEAVMLALGDRIGRLDAHRLVEHASKEAVASGRTLFDVLSADAAVMQHLSSGQLKHLLDPANYAGEAQAFVDAALELHHANA
jgi:3-carboxy-cis,cis-muconate cycloisomerase